MTRDPGRATQFHSRLHGEPPFLLMEAPTALGCDASSLANGFPTFPKSKHDGEKESRPGPGAKRDGRNAGLKLNPDEPPERRLPGNRRRSPPPRRRARRPTWA